MEDRPMAIYKCDVCGWEYDEEKGSEELGIAPGTPFSELPEETSVNSDSIALCDFFAVTV